MLFKPTVKLITFIGIVIVVLTGDQIDQNTNGFNVSLKLYQEEKPAYYMFVCYMLH